MRYTKKIFESSTYMEKEAVKEQVFYSLFLSKNFMILFCYHTIFIYSVSISP